MRHLLLAPLAQIRTQRQTSEHLGGHAGGNQLCNGAISKTALLQLLEAVLRTALVGFPEATMPSSSVQFSTRTLERYRIAMQTWARDVALHLLSAKPIHTEYSFTHKMMGI